MKGQVVLVLAIIFVVLVAFVIAPKEYYSEKHPILDEIRRRFKEINPKYGKIPLKTGDKSYTTGKRAITLCIVDPETKKYYDINTITYVAIHELAHVINPESGKKSHGELFKTNFTRLLRDAAKKGLYDPTKPIAENYCGADDDE